MTKMLIAWLILMVVIVFAVLIWAVVLIVISGNMGALLISILGLFIMYDEIIKILVKKFKGIE